MPKPSDIATFPELFDGTEQFFEEQTARLKRAGLMTITVAAGAGLALAWVMMQLP